MKGSLPEIQHTMTNVYEFVGLPVHTLTVKDIGAKNSRDYTAMSDVTRGRLEEFYKPHNERLMTLLASHNINLHPW